MSSAGLVYIVILNWNGWKDTLECLESVFRNDYPNYRVIVCDNDSSDRSAEKIVEWAQGKRSAGYSNPDLAALTRPVLQKPVRHVVLDRTAAESGRLEGEEPPLIIVQTGANLGFAGGNNVGLRYALARGGFHYAWLLNNDTVIAPDALRALVERMEAEPEAGICGSTLAYYHAPERVQALGGACYNRWRCRAMPIGAMQPVEQAVDECAVESKLAYVAGASMLVRERFLFDIGLMAEDYFLYFEEFDWAARARGRYRQCYAPASLVYHKEGGSIGSGDTGTRSALSIYYLLRNRVRFVSRFYRPYLPLLGVSVLLELGNALLRRDFYELRWMLAALSWPASGATTREKR